MATILEQRSHQQLGMGYDNTKYATPQFTDPWSSTTSASTSHALYQTSSAAVQQQYPRSGSLSSVIYPPSTSSASIPPDAMQSRSAYGNGYGIHNTAYAPTSTSQYSTQQAYTSPSSYAPYDAQVQRRASYPVKPSVMSRGSFNDALDASQGMVAMSQDVTPRVGYGSRTASVDYGFPSSNSHTSSISSTTSNYPHYYHGSYNGSIDGSVAGSVMTDYSTDNDGMASRSMSSAGLHAFPQEQAAMMTQFNSKMSASAQKKHKCKICDKRFTRPSSLQTHMYSHTGEKPFACDFDGCGRHFSVVSNLRRHKKCHRNNSIGSSCSGDEDSVSHHSHE